VFPLVFFYRRTFFIIATVFMFDYPTIQMIVNQTLSFGVVVYLVSDRQQFETTLQKIIELGTETLYFCTSLFLT